jgi:predicted DNA-binding transcriptional regulator AlpA
MQKEDIDRLHAGLLGPESKPWRARSPQWTYKREMPIELLTVEDLEKIIKLSRRTIMRACKTGDFPMPKLIPQRAEGGKGKKLWLSSDIFEWMDSLQSEGTMQHVD